MLSSATVLAKKKEMQGYGIQIFSTAQMENWIIRVVLDGINDGIDLYLTVSSKR